MHNYGTFQEQLLRFAGCIDEKQESELTELNNVFFHHIVLPVTAYRSQPLWFEKTPATEVILLLVDNADIFQSRISLTLCLPVYVSSSIRDEIIEYQGWYQKCC